LGFENGAFRSYIYKTMKNIIIICLTCFLGNGIIYAQVNDEDYIFSHDSLMWAQPADPVINGVVPGDCGTNIISIGNNGQGKLTISALYLDDVAGNDEFELINPEQVPFEIDTTEWVDVRIDFCPVSAGEKNTLLIVEYGDGKILQIPIRGVGAIVFDMDWCDNFNSWSTGEWIGNGWTGTVPASLSVYPSATQGWGGTPDGSIALFLRNRHQVDDQRVPIQVTTPGVRVSGDDPVISWDEMAYSSFNTTGTNSSPRNLYISIDGSNWEMVDSYLSSSMPDPSVDAGDWFRQKIYSLKDYVGKTIC